MAKEKSFIEERRSVIFFVCKKREHCNPWALVLERFLIYKSYFYLGKLQKIQIYLKRI